MFFEVSSLTYHSPITIDISLSVVRQTPAIVVGIEEQVPNRADRVARAGAATRCDRVHADKHDVEFSTLLMLGPVRHMVLFLNSAHVTPLILRSHRSPACHRTAGSSRPRTAKPLSSPVTSSTVK